MSLRLHALERAQVHFPVLSVGARAALLCFALLAAAGCRSPHPVSSEGRDTGTFSPEREVELNERQEPNAGKPAEAELILPEEEEPSLPQPIFPRHLPQLDSFYASLDALHRGERAQPVRILWLGDSHTAADFMTHPVREHLESRLPAGGPGFVRVGLPAYRQTQVRVELQGKWRTQPIAPSQRTRVLDGEFGYGGIRVIPRPGAGVQLSLRGAAEDESYRWTWTGRLRPGAALEMRWGAEKRILTEKSQAGQAGFALQEPLSLAGKSTVTLRQVAGEPEVYGVFIENERPGVVLDTVGINGARAATPLAWDAEHYLEAVRVRPLELVVFAFGTNEVFDKGDPKQYKAHFSELWARLQQASPGAACWIIGPPDSASIQGGSLPRVALVTQVQREVAAELGCAFTSAQELMGGEGSFVRWMHSSPPGARSDRVHLTISGYEKLGRLLAEQLLPSSP